MKPRPPLIAVVMPFVFALMAFLLAGNWWASLPLDMPWRLILPAIGVAIGLYALMMGVLMVRMWHDRR